MLCFLRHLAVTTFTVVLMAGTLASPNVVAASTTPTITAIAAGSQFTCALIAGGTVRCWGRNLEGQLGDGTTTTRLSPVAVAGVSTATAISAGQGHACALLANGTVRCWGWNQDGQLGDGTTTDRLIPVAVSGITDAVAINAGANHTCAVLPSGVRCWGYNAFGQLGDGTLTNRLVPVEVGWIFDAVPISVGGSNHTCAFAAAGTPQCWGANGHGQLGDGTTTDRRRTVPVLNFGDADATAIATGSDHTCAVVTDGTLRCWGYNASGQLGNGTTTERHTPVTVSAISTATTVAAGYFHTCAVLSDGTARCWGHGFNGQLGDGAGTNRLDPVTVSGISTATAVAAGDWHSCALLVDGVVRCWGWNEYGELGDGTTTQRNTPVAVVFPATPFTDIAGSPFKPDIEWVYTAGITSGCTATAYCPDGYVTREQMASFLARALKLTGTAPDAFTDDEASPHEPNINLVAKAGIATGCAATKYCPAALVSREQMASFLARALKLAGTAPDAFTDDEQSIHEPNINLVAKAGVATGCGGRQVLPHGQRHPWPDGRLPPPGLRAVGGRREEGYEIDPVECDGVLGPPRGPGAWSRRRCAGAD